MQNPISPATRHTLALRWLTRTQQTSGAWEDVTTTALATLAYLRAGHTDRRGDYRPQIANALAWLEGRIAQATSIELSLIIWVALERARQQNDTASREQATRHFGRLPGGGIEGRWMLASHAVREDAEPLAWYVVVHQVASELGLPRTGDATRLAWERETLRPSLTTWQQPFDPALADTELGRLLQDRLTASPLTDAPTALRQRLLLALLLDETDAFDTELAANQETEGREEGSVRWKGASLELATAVAAHLFWLGR